MARVLLYNFSGKPKLGKISLALMRSGVRGVCVPRESFGAAVGELAEAAEMPVCEKEAPFDGELIVMCGLSDRQLDFFLSELRRQKVFVPAKAVLTETNAAWNGAELSRELLREREAFAQTGKSVHESEAE